MASRLQQEWSKPDNLLRIEGWVREGMSVEDIARKKIGVTGQTFYNWINQNLEFFDAIKKGREPRAVIIENSAFDRCQWKQVTEETTEIIQKADGSEEKRVRRVKKWIPPDTAITIFMLKNLLPDRYKEHPKGDGDSKALEKLDELLGSFAGEASKIKKG